MLCVHVCVCVWRTVDTFLRTAKLLRPISTPLEDGQEKLLLGLKLLGLSDLMEDFAIPSTQQNTSFHKTYLSGDLHIGIVGGRKLLPHTLLLSVPLMIFLQTMNGTFSRYQTTVFTFDDTVLWECNSRPCD